MQSGPTLAFSLWLSDFKIKTSFGLLIKKCLADTSTVQRRFAKPIPTPAQRSWRGSTSADEHTLRSIIVQKSNRASNLTLFLPCFYRGWPGPRASWMWVFYSGDHGRGRVGRGHIRGVCPRCRTVVRALARTNDVSVRLCMV